MSNHNKIRPVNKNDLSGKYKILFSKPQSKNTKIPIKFQGLQVYNNKKEEWIHADLFVQANVLLGFEKINSLGIIWEPCNKTDHVYNAILKLAVNK